MLTVDQRFELFKQGWKSADVRKAVKDGQYLTKWGVFEKTEMVFMPTLGDMYTYKATITTNIHFADGTCETKTFQALAETRMKALQRCYRAARVYQMYRSTRLVYLVKCPVKPLKKKAIHPTHPIAA